MSRYRIGVDIGGTFTDFVMVDAEARRIHLAKRLTTHGDYLEAVFAGLEELLARTEIAAADVAGVVHGTTLVTNTVIERKGAKTALHNDRRRARRRRDRRGIALRHLRPRHRASGAAGAAASAIRGG